MSIFHKGTPSGKWGRPPQSDTHAKTYSVLERFVYIIILIYTLVVSNYLLVTLHLYINVNRLINWFLLRIECPYSRSHKPL